MHESDKIITIKTKTKTDQILSASFMPLCGMNMISYKKGNKEVIDQTTTHMFKERFAGLGAMIGPHFHHRSEIPPIANERLFPHIASVKSSGKKEPFSHGIGRYAPWDYTASQNSIEATLTGSHIWKGIALKDLEGFDFLMKYKATIHETGLDIELNVEGEKPCIIGLHTYYRLAKNNYLTAQVKHKYNDLGEFKPLPRNWLNQQQSHLRLPINQSLDYGFLPEATTKGRALLETSEYNLLVSFSSDHEISLQVYHPENSSFVCIEPLSVKNPRKLTTNCSSITVNLEILP